MSAEAPGSKTRLIVIYGGRSAEHEVSCISALHVVRAADPARYDVRVVGITTQGRWVEVPREALDQGEGGARSLPSPDTIEDRLRDRAERPGQDAGLPAADRGFQSVLALAVEPAPAQQPPPATGAPPAISAPPATAPIATHTAAAPQVVALPLLHGPMGEDGTVQGLLEVAGIPYCGPGVAGSAAAMDKGLAKRLLSSAGLPQARYILLREGELGPGIADRVGSELGWPVFVKPANMGSSIGITRASGPDHLLAGLDLAFRYDEFVVIEEAVIGARELEIGVLGWPDLRTSVPGEIKPSHDFYDFDDKYVDGSAGLEVPAQIPDEIAAEMSRLAIEACNAVRVDSMARVDFFWEQSGRGLLINEINTIPGFTPISMYPQMWAASGIPYSQLVNELVEQALRRADRRRRFDTHHS